MRNSIESIIEQSTKDLGYRADIVTCVEEWTLTGTTPTVATLLTNGQVFSFSAAADATKSISLSLIFPGEYAPTPALSQTVSQTTLFDDFKVRAWMRKVDATADENATLGATCQVYWGTLGASATAWSSLTTAASSGVLAASSTGANLSSFALVQFDVGARLRAENKRILSGDYVRIVIAPDATVGSADMTLQVMPPVIRIRRHAALRAESERGM